ncbi:MAG: hypothetical protein IIC32_09350 [Chloroflexi bacterium]|nr:hypothetical protein [Chloroflexota bacterium]
MAVVSVDIISRRPYAKGRSFGEAGAYERLDGLLTFAVDPSHEANRAIVDLDLAPRDDAGLVHFSADFVLLVPQTPALGNRRLIVDVVNRGRQRVVGTFNLAPPTTKGSAGIPVGDGFLFRRGYAVASVGWQWDVYRSTELMGLEAPVADVDGQVLVEIRPDVVQRTRSLANRVHRPYPAADVDEAAATIYVRDWEDGPYTVVPRNQWRFARETDGVVVPSAEHVYMEGGFQPGKIYHVVYTTHGSPVAGTGLLAIRDAASLLRHASALNPVDGGFERVYGYGVSQTGRLLRHFVYLGLNEDEQGRPVYDGLLAHVAGARRGEFNQRFAQPSVQSTPGFGHLFPFADDDMADPLTEASDGLLNKARSQGAVPRIFYTNSSAEYWRGDSSLVHIDPAGLEDIAPAPETRVYLFAGTQHANAESLSAPDDLSVDGTMRRYPPNVVDLRPLLRAALVNLDRWVSSDEEPPPSAHPRLDDGTAVSPARALASLGVVPGLATPDPERLWVLRETDMGPEAAKGVARYPVEEGRAYPSHVSAVDADGNEIAGIRLPDLTAPIGTHAGWNLRHPDSGAPEQIIPMVGFTLPFAATRQAREASGDPRPSIQERYESRDAYLQQVRHDAESLVAERYLLAEDTDVVVAACAAHYDAAMAGTLG